jgi:hypothetical protein
VVSKDGKLVGFVMAEITLKNCSIVVDPHAPRNLGLSSMAGWRDEDGSIDFQSIWFNQYDEVNVVALMCADVIDERAGAKSLGELYMDT